MKLHYIVEGIHDVRKYYPNIPDDVFMQIIKLDPTYRGGDSLGKYGKWILNLYNRGSITEDDFEEITPILQQFTTYRNRVANKDLNSYKTLQDLSDILASVVDDDSMLSPRQKVRFLKNVKAGRVKVSKEDDYDIVLDTPNYVVYVPNTHEASMKLGKGTKWCTAHENPQWYNHYTEDGGKLYIVKSKETGERWQYSDKSEDFLNQNDEKFDIPALMRTDAKLSKFFEKYLRVDFYSFDGTWVYKWEPIPKNLQSSVTKVIIDDRVTYIGDDAFSNCLSLTSITIPDRVTWIGDGAFARCSSLTSITIPNSVTSIGAFAFANCSSLTSIKIPDSVTEIGKYAFSKCTSLTSITIPNSVTKILDNTFNVCSSLTSVKIPNSVTEIADWAFYNCSSMTSIKIPDSVTSIWPGVFYGCKNLIVYTDNKYVIDYCKDKLVPVKPASEFKNESVYRPLKLRIRESNKRW